MATEQPSGTPTIFAAVGDVHGRMHAMVRPLTDWERRTKQRLSFVLQVGDFEAVRDAEELASMPVPEKYRLLGDFPSVTSGNFRVLPVAVRSPPPAAMVSR